MTATGNRCDALENAMGRQRGEENRMNDTVLKIALAGLLHDVGKFAQGCLELSRQYR